MTIVKGSEQYNLRVVSYRPGYYRVAAVMAVVALVLVALGSFALGRYLTHAEYLDTDKELLQLQQDLAVKTKLAGQLQQSISNLNLGSEVDRRANTEVQTQLVELKNTISELEERVGFYRGLMSPSDNKRGLTIGKFNLESTAIVGQYRYKAVVQQVAANHKMLSGQLNINIIGKQAGAAQVLSLKDLSATASESQIRLRFKYFQNITGQLRLPDGFVPEQVQVLAKSTGRNAVSVEKTFGWSLSQR